MPNISITQVPNDVIAAQSPIVFTVRETNNDITASGYQFAADVYMWSGSASPRPAEPIYSLRKYPNVASAGIFDITRIASSKFRQLTLEDTSSVQWLSVDFYDTWLNPSLSGSSRHYGNTIFIDAEPLNDVRFKILDAYDLFPDSVNTPLQFQTGSGIYHPFPIMTDMGIISQSCLITDKGEVGYFVAPFNGNTGLGLSPYLRYTGVYENGSTVTSNVNIVAVDASKSVNQVRRVSIYPGSRSVGTDPWEHGFPLALTNGGSNLKSYSVTLIGGTFSNSICFDVVCEPKYTPIRVMWKNRYGQVDYFNFYKKSTSTFSTEQRVFSPQLGNYNDGYFSYNKNQSATQRYIVDSKEQMTVNTDFVEENFSYLLKQMMVSDELYWVNGTDYIPISIVTNSLEMLKSVNNKLIQYTLTFDISRNYKLVL